MIAEERLAKLQTYMQLARTSELTLETTPHLFISLNGPAEYRLEHDAQSALCLYPDGAYAYFRLAQDILTEEEAGRLFLELTLDPRAVAEHERYRRKTIQAGAATRGCSDEEELQYWIAGDMESCEGGNLPTIMTFFARQSSGEWLCSFAWLRSASLQEVFTFFQTIAQAIVQSS